MKWFELHFETDQKYSCTYINGPTFFKFLLGLAVFSKRGRKGVDCLHFGGHQRDFYWKATAMSGSSSSSASSKPKRKGKKGKTFHAGRSTKYERYFKGQTQDERAQVRAQNREIDSRISEEQPQMLQQADREIEKAAKVDAWLFGRVVNVITGKTDTKNSYEKIFQADGRWSKPFTNADLSDMLQKVGDGRTVEDLGKLITAAKRQAAALVRDGDSDPTSRFVQFFRFFTEMIMTKEGVRIYAIMNKMSENFHNINQTREQKGDSRNLTAVNKTVLRQAELIAGSSKGLDPTMISRGLKRGFSVIDAEDVADIDSPIALDWKKLGKAASCYWRCAPHMHFFFGELGKSDGPVVVRQRKKRKVFQRENVKQTKNLKKKHSDHDTENFASKIQEEMKKIAELKSDIEMQGMKDAGVEPGRDWLNLIVCKDPQTGFGQTVENLFTSANLQRHGYMEVSIGTTSENKNSKRATHGLENIAGIPTCVRTERAGNSSDNSRPDIACVVTLDKARWRELCEVNEESWMPVRDYEKGDYSKFMPKRRDEVSTDEDEQEAFEEEDDMFDGE
jgi:hypothetical protein